MSVERLAGREANLLPAEDEPSIPADDPANRAENQGERFQYQEAKLVSPEEVKAYYRDLIEAFKNELSGTDRRSVLRQFFTGKRLLNNEQGQFFRELVENAFLGKDPYPPALPASPERTIKNSEKLLQRIIKEGYSPSSPFVIQVCKELGIEWRAWDWYTDIENDICDKDKEEILKELNSGLLPPHTLPKKLAAYYYMGSGLERIVVDPEEGITNSLLSRQQGSEKYLGFNPLEYIDEYYQSPDREDMTISREFYDILLANRTKLPPDSKALIVGNGPVPYVAYLLAMIPEIKTIIPSDFDERNNNLMAEHTGRKTPSNNPKARSNEEDADYVNFLFEQRTGVRFRVYPVREATAEKTQNPVFGDITQENPLDLPENPAEIKNLRSDLVVVPFCPESITSDFESYRGYLKNIASLIAPGGHLSMLALKNARFYKSGKGQLEAVPIDEQKVFEALIALGFKNIQITTIKTGIDPTDRGFSDSMIIWADKA